MQGAKTGLCKSTAARRRAISPFRVAALAAFMIGASVSNAIAGPDWQAGHITNVTFVGNEIMIMLDSGIPDWCAGTPSGWMMIPASAKAMQSFVLGLWMRGDAAQITVTAYAAYGYAGPGSGYCQLNQIDPVG